MKVVEGMPLFNYISKDDLIYKKKQFGNNNKKINGKTKKDMEKDFKILTNSQRLKILSQLALTLFKFKNMVYKEKNKQKIPIGCHRICILIIFLLI